MLHTTGKKPLIALVNLAVMAFALCSSLERADNQGPGTEVIGRAVVPSDSSPVHGTVLLRKNDFLADTGGHDSGLPQTITAADGSFSFDNVEPGAYTIEVLDTSRLSKRLAAIIRVDVPADVPQVDAGKGLMKQVGLISGNLETPGAGSWVQVYGLQCVAKADPATGGFILRDIPEGEYLLHIASSSSAVGPSVPDSVPARSGDTVQVPFAGWRYSKRLYCNTSSSGAGVPGTVLHFPVLVRLTANNFSFSQARHGGEDVRFTKQDGSLLPFEIERWDSSLARAEIWVNVDTVYGNNSSQYIMMYWGTSTGLTASASNGAAVFDTAQGNIGVWHLGPGLGDATAYGDNGIDSSTSDTAGNVGRCRWFDPEKHSFIAIPNESRFNMTVNITLSAWILADTTVLEWQTVIAKGDNTYRLHRDSTSNVMCFSMTTADTADYGYKDLPGSTPINDRAWHLVCGVFDGSVMRIYVDGALEGERTVNMPCLTNDSSVTIGDNKPRSQRFFHGAIDEVRVMHAVVSADWVRLCYMNQKADGDALVVFK